MKKIAVVGMGYVGIPAAALFADNGFDVTGIQRRSRRSGWKIDWLNEGRNPIGGKEPGLEELIHRVVIEKKSFRVVDDFSVVKDMDAVLIDVQTPTDENGIPKYGSLKEVSKEVGERMERGVLVVLESTVAPGTTQFVVQPILEEKSGLKAGEDFSLVFSYERVMVGRLLHNIVNYPRIIGGIDERSTERAMDLYSNIVKADLIPCDALTAEIAKVVENTYRDVNIAFANEVALICEGLGVDAFEVRELVNSLPNDPSDPATNPYRNMHFPGAGVGGHCLPKDPWLLKYGLDRWGKKGKKSFSPKIIVDARKINAEMPFHMADLIKKALNENNIGIENSKICILGFAFLQNSDDTRNTPSLPLYDHLKDNNANVIIHDPYVKKYEGINLTSNLDRALTNTDCLALVTAHDEYLHLDLDHAKNVMGNPIIVDGRNAFDKEKMEGIGFAYYGLGKG